MDRGICRESFVFSVVYTRTFRLVCPGTSDKWAIPWYITRKRCMTILFQVKENTQHYSITAVHDGKGGGIPTNIHGFPALWLAVFSMVWFCIHISTCQGVPRYISLVCTYDRIHNTHIHGKTTVFLNHQSFNKSTEKKWRIAEEFSVNNVKVSVYITENKIV